MTYTSTMDNEIMTIRQTADYLKISRIQCYRYVKRDFNPIPTSRISEKTLRVSKKELLQWLEYSCPVCSHEMNSIIENSGFDDQPNWQPSGKLKCSNCGATK